MDIKQAWAYRPISTTLEARLVYGSGLSGRDCERFTNDSSNRILCHRPLSNVLA